MPYDRIPLLKKMQVFGETENNKLITQEKIDKAELALGLHQSLIGGPSDCQALSLYMTQKRLLF